MRLLQLDSGTAMRGGQWQVLRLAEGLAQLGHEVTLLVPKRSPCYRMARRAGLDPGSLTALAVRQTSRKSDLVHAHDAHSHTLAAVMAVAPVIVSRRVGFPIRGGLSHWKYGRARHFVAVSNYVKSVLIAGGVEKEKISVVYDGVPLLASAIPSEKIVVPASVDPRKGTALALEAISLAGLSPKLSNDLERDLPGASMFLYITYSEGLGSGILLAMSAGVPVVASRIGGVPEIVEDGESGLLVANTAVDIAAAILRLRDREFSGKLVERARHSVEENFSIAAMVKGTIRVYERALSC